MTHSRQRFAAEVYRIRPGLEWVRGRCDRFDFPPHAHAEITLGRVLSGREVVSVSGKRDVIGPGDVYFTRPGEAHSGASHYGSAWAYESIYICPGQLLRLGLTTDLRPELSRPTMASSDLFDPDDSDDEEIDALLASLFVLGRNWSEPEKSSANLACDLRVRLEERYADPISISQLAEDLGVADSTAISAFRSAYGLTPGSYLRSLRLAEARSLLREGISLAEVACLAGFYDQSHMHRHFFRQFGFTPGRYQAATACR